MIGELLYLLVALCVFALVAYGVWWLCVRFEVPKPVMWVCGVLLIVLLLAFLAGRLGLIESFQLRRGG